MAMHPRDGTIEGQTAMESSKEIFEGKGRGAIDISVPEKIGTADNPIYRGLELLGKYFGWVTSNEHRERKPKPPPKPEPKAGGTYRTSEDIGEYPFSEAYGSMIKRMLREKSHYPIVMRDRGEILDERKSIGYETGTDKTIEIARDLPWRKFADVYFHEEAALDMLGNNRFDGDHEAMHPQIIAEGKRRTRAFKDYLSAMMD
ncbi:MAG TPA: hypothetical protein VJB05_00500 [archaeon]|nr:hypothetical protein [archaeon]